MPKYYEMNGRFAKRYKYMPENQFSGFVELEDEQYKNEKYRGRTVCTQYFKGIQFDSAEPSAKPNLILGSLELFKDYKRISFKKLSNVPGKSPLSFSLGSSKEGIYGGSFRSDTEINPRSEPAQITTFRELSDEQVKEKRVKELLERGYAETEISKLSFQMKYAALCYDYAKQTVIKSGEKNVIKDGKLSKLAINKGSSHIIGDNLDETAQTK